MTPLEFRKSKNFTLAQMADLLSFSKSYIQEVEVGKKTPSFALARAYFKASGGSVNLLDEA